MCFIFIRLYSSNFHALSIRIVSWLFCTCYCKKVLCTVSFELSRGDGAPILVQLRQMSEITCISIHENNIFDSMYTSQCTIYAQFALLALAAI